MLAGPQRLFCLQPGHFASDSRRLNGEVSQADQIVNSTGEGEHPIHFLSSAMAHLAHQRDGFQPAKALLDALAFPLAGAVALMSRRTRVDGAAAAPLLILRNMRGNVHVPAFGNEILGVEPLVASHRDAPLAVDLLQHQHRGQALGSAGGRPHHGIHDQTVAILHQNSQCVLNGATSSALVSGNNLTVNSGITFLPAFTGSKNIYSIVQDTINNLSSTWNTAGTWTLP
jgi:hypothetical protein